MSKHELYEKASRAYKERFNVAPEMIVRAPGRVNLIGEHTDYNDGFVMPVAVDRAAWVASGPSGSEWSTVRAIDMNNDEKTFPVNTVPASAGGWSDYPMGVVWAFLERELTPAGINAVLTSDVPVGAGMSSSAAVELAFAYTWNTMGNFGISKSDLALLCQSAENSYVGVNCGIMDQMISACGKAGHAMMLDTRTLERGYFSMPEGVAVLVADSKVRRKLSGSEYNVRRAQCEQAVSILQTHRPEITALRDVTVENLERWGHEMPEVVLQRARHVVTENDRVLKVAKLLYEGNMTQAGQYLIEGHKSLRDDYEVSIPELDTLVEAASEAEGCYGARLTGAGFGGCIIALAAEDAVDEVKEHISRVYDDAYNVRPAVYVTYAADGVDIVE